MGYISPEACASAMVLVSLAGLSPQVSSFRCQRALLYPGVVGIGISACYVAGWPNIASLDICICKIMRKLLKEYFLPGTASREKTTTCGSTSAGALFWRVRCRFCSAAFQCYPGCLESFRIFDTLTLWMLLISRLTFHLSQEILLLPQVYAVQNLV